MIFNELQCMVSEFTVSKPVSQLKQIPVQTLQKKLSLISRHLESQVQNSKAVLSLFCMFAEAPPN
jgi:hypothetical protein